MAEFISSRHLIDVVIAVTLLEGVSLLAFHRLTKRGLAPGDYLLNLISGLCLMFALRCAVSNTAWTWIALWLLASGAAHGADLWRRTRK